MWLILLLILRVQTTSAVKRGYGAERIYENACEDLQEGKFWISTAYRTEYVANRIAVGGMLTTIKYKIADEDVYELWSSNVTLIWNEGEEHAVAAFARASFIAAGYMPDRVNVINKNEPLVFSNDTYPTLTVEVLPVNIFAHLSPHALQSPDCVNATDWSFYKDKRNLQNCDFLTTGKPWPEAGYVGVVFPSQLGIDVCSNTGMIFTPSYNNIKSSFLSYHSQCANRSNLQDLEHNFNGSFMFYTAERWSNSSSVRILRGIPLLDSKYILCTHTSNISHRYPLILPDNTLLCLYFSPLIYSTITQARHHNVSLEAAACYIRITTRYNTYDDYGGDDDDDEDEDDDDDILRLDKLISMSNNDVININVYILSDKKEDIHIFFYVLKLLRDLNFFTSEIKIKTYFDNERSLLSYKKWNASRNNHVSVIVTQNYPELKRSMKMPIYTYGIHHLTLQRQSNRVPVYSVTGTLVHLVESLQYLLFSCHWRRLAIISDETKPSIQLDDILSKKISKYAGDTLIRNVVITRMINEYGVLRDLVTADARVILVNTNASTAAQVLTAAQDMNMTADAGFVWIVREYDKADNGTVYTRPLLLSFGWRGGETNKTGESLLDSQLATLRKRLDMRWRKRAWPVNAAPMTDALLMMTEELQRLRSRNSSVPLSIRSDEKRRYLSSLMKEKKIRGITHELEFNELGLNAPFVYVHQWGAQPWPRVLATWRVGEWGPTDAACPLQHPPSDGTLDCWLAEGDPFTPICHDSIIITTIVITILCLVLIPAVVLWSRRAIKKRERRLKVNISKKFLVLRERVLGTLAHHLVDRAHLEVGEELGSGRFGHVQLGMLQRYGKITPVAVKSLRDDASHAEETDFLKEASMLVDLNHERIVRFVGVCVVDGPVLILMERVHFGDLAHYLRARRHLVDGTVSVESIGLEENAHVSREALTGLARDAAAALAYLSERNIVHRDVRASNCLVDEQRRLKLADFGLARVTGTKDGEYACRRRGLFPVLYMAPESLKSGVSSAASDVWALGMLVWEVVTLGRRPYDSRPLPSVYRHVVEGGVPPVPDDVNRETRCLLRACWQSEAAARATAHQIHAWLVKRYDALRPALDEQLVEIDTFDDLQYELIFDASDLD